MGKGRNIQGRGSGVEGNSRIENEQKIWAYELFPALVALHLVVHEHNAYIPRILHWRSNTLPRFYELMSQVFENREPYWTWGDSVDNTEELVELVGDDAEQKTSTSASVEEKDEDIEETASLPSSSKASITYFPIYMS
ncbi:unnamed protein product [Prunus armeniaca]